MILIFVFFVSKAQENDLIYDFERKVNDAFGQSFMSKDVAPFLNLEKQLYQERAKLPNNTAQYNYWLSYNQYYKSIFYSVVKKNNSQAKKEIDAVIARLQDTLPSRNSEEHSLLALAECFSISFISNGIKANLVAKKVMKRCEKAIELDPNNLRPYFVLGQLDYFKPAMWGGKTECEGYFKKALAMDEQKIKNHYTPSWGKKESFEYLIKFYLDEKKKSEAKTYYLKAIKIYPNEYLIKDLASKLID